MPSSAAASHAAVVGSGPNGLAAAVILARAGVPVTVYEQAPRIGGGMRTEELMEPGHVHDLGSAVHPMSFASPFFTGFEIQQRIRWFTPEISFGHPLDGGRAALAQRSFEATVADLGPDGGSYRALLEPMVRHTEDVVAAAMNPVLAPPRFGGLARPNELTSRFQGLAALGRTALWQGTPAWNLGFRGEAAPGLFSGVAAHAEGRMPAVHRAAAGAMLHHLAHTVGWPVPQGGSVAIAEAMAADIRAHGGVIRSGEKVSDLRDLPGAVVLLDVTPRALADLADLAELPSAYERRLRRFRYGDGICKVDFILSGPVPWADERLHGTGTVHVGGTRAQIARAEAQVTRGQHPERPYVLLSQPSEFDPTRAPSGRHVLWTYAHVPSGSSADMSEAIIGQIERFAPGFRDVIISHRTTSAAQLSRLSPNFVGGDLGSGAMSLRQTLARPVFGAAPWKTPLPGVYLCSGSTAPGPGVHGMGGYHAARLALREVFGLPMPSLGAGT